MNRSEPDTRFHFFPWFLEKEYVRDGTEKPAQATERYFQSLASHPYMAVHYPRIRFSTAQMRWYEQTAEEMGYEMNREFPSLPEEAFAKILEGAYYGRDLEKARREDRIGKIDWETDSEVHTAWDL